MPELPRLLCDTPIGDVARLRLWSHDRSRRSDHPAAAHAGVELAWVDAGEVRYRIGARELVARAGDAVLVPAGVDHATSIGPSTRAGAIWIEASAFDAIAGACESSSIAAGLFVRARSVTLLGSVLSAEMATRDLEATGVACESIVTSIAALLARSSRRATRAPVGDPAARPRGRARDVRVSRVLDRIHDAYAEPLVVDDLARLAGVNRFHLSRLFRDETGLPPYRYLLRHRVRRAAELLESGRCNVTEAAYGVGFNDLGRFARAFKQHLGVAPSEVARRSRSKSHGVASAKNAMCESPLLLSTKAP